MALPHLDHSGVIETATHLAAPALAAAPGRGDRATRLEMLRELAGKVAPVSLASERSVEVGEPLQPLLPRGLPRGSVCAVGPTDTHQAPAPGTTTLALTVAAGASAAGGWCAAVGFPDLSPLGASRVGLRLDRFALVPDPGRHWATITAALLEAMAVVLLAPPERVTPSEVRRLRARAREQGAVLVPVAGAHRWQHPADVRLWVTRSSWTGLDGGWGFLQDRTLEVAGEGRGVAGRHRHLHVQVPA